MPESALHAELVQVIVRYAEQRFGGFANIAVLEDAVRPVRNERPPRIEGHVPDVFVTDVPTTVTLIGEAKSQHDLETEHSRRQIAAFLGYLSKTRNGIFVLSVPLAAGATASRILSQFRRSFSDSPTQMVVLEGPMAERR